MIKKVKKGFTLIELVVVIAVIAILSAVSVVAYVGITNSAKKSAAQQEADQIAMTIRAAALTSADGYTEQFSNNAEKTAAGSSARYTVVWTKDGLVVYNLSADELKPEVVFADMYAELEEAAAPGTISVEGTAGAAIAAKDGTVISNSTVAEFKYAKESISVVAKFTK